MILELVREARAAGARLGPCCEIIEIDVRTIQRWLKHGLEGGEDGRRGPKTTPANKLSDVERAQIIELVTSAEFRDLPPSQLVPRLADMGIYVASESTIHRLLKQHSLNAHRGRHRQAKNTKPREHCATGPNQVWCWDITYLRAPTRGAFFYLYLFLDVWSRKIVGWRVHDREDNELSAKAFVEICEAEGADPKKLVLHSDNGGPMKGATMVATLESLGVTRSLSRPSVSNDNPFVESTFRTVKGHPSFPDKPFESLEAASTWVAEFVAWYNEEHRHSGISFVTPGQRHTGVHEALLEHREHVYAAAKARHPERWTGNTRRWDRHATVRLNPTHMPSAGQDATANSAAA